MAGLEIIGFPISTYVRGVRILCEEKGVPYTLVATPPHQGDVKRIHPYGKVPVMRHGKVELFESRAIAAYIEGKFKGKKMLPGEAQKAAQCEQWISFTNAHVYPTIISSYVLPNLFPGEGGQVDRAKIEAAVPEMEKQVKLLDKALAATGYLAGRGYTYADMNLMPIINYARMFPEGQKIVGKAKAVTAWFERNAKRKSWKATEPPRG